MDIVIYHANCADGFTAAWILWKYGNCKNAKFIPYQYGDGPPDVKDLKGKDVIIVDFSFKRDILLRLKDQSKSLVVLDHHETAQKELEGLDFCTFDMNKCGARLAWEYCLHATRSTYFIEYIEDRDLWLWKLEGSKEINEAIKSYEYTFENWGILESSCNDFYKNPLYSEGKALLRIQTKYINNIKSKFMVKLCGYLVPFVNTTCYHSELGHKLSVGYPFSCTWFWVNGKFIYSLRSQEDGIDVSVIAKHFCGGGRKHAAGFTLNNLLNAIQEAT